MANLELLIIIAKFPISPSVCRGVTAKLNRLDGTTTEEEDWIDLNDNIAFAFKNPQSVIREIDKVEIA